MIIVQLYNILNDNSTTIQYNSTTINDSTVIQYLNDNSTIY